LVGVFSTYVFATPKKHPEFCFAAELHCFGRFPSCFCYIKTYAQIFLSCGAYLVRAFSILFLLHQKTCPNIVFLRSSFGLGVFDPVFATPKTSLIKKTYILPNVFFLRRLDGYICGTSKTPMTKKPTITPFIFHTDFAAVFSYENHRIEGSTGFSLCRPLARIPHPPPPPAWLR
jgi:hypothetical protein